MAILEDIKTAQPEI